MAFISPDVMKEIPTLLEKETPLALRSLLFVPADDQKKLNKARESAADALILDLEDAVALVRKPEARELTLEFLRQPRRQTVFVRINAVSTDHALPDLAQIMAGAPDGIMLPKCSAPRDLVTLENYLSAFEAREGQRLGGTRILPILFEEAKAAFSGHVIGNAPTRLAGMIWGVEDLAAEFGSTGRDAGGALLPPFEMGRTLCLYTAVAAQVPAIDAAFAAFRDMDGLEREVRYVESIGFQGKVAIHPGQIDTINRIFTPSPENVDEAMKIVDAFSSQRGVGVVGLEGKMLDRPHLLLAQRVLARAEAAAGCGK